MTVPSFEGPFGYENWRAYNSAQPSHGGGEALLYSDSRFTGELTSELGPYQLVHTLAFSSPGTLAPVFALRMDHHLPPDLSEGVVQGLFHQQKTVLAHYHGGSIYDEIAALLSLTHGVRLQAGPVTRSFDGKDPRGRQMTPDEAPPALLPTRGSLVVPNAVRECKAQAGLVPSYPLLSPADGLALIRAARSYQEALWVAEGDPQLAWLLLVSAVETAAVRWFRATNAPEGTDEEVLRAGNPQLTDLLDAAGGADLVRQVAKHIAQGMRAGYKFRTFLTAFTPAPPLPRPAEWGALDWSATALKRTLMKVYEHRSKALHESIPFPLPMCSRPMQFNDDDGHSTLTETPGGGAMFAEGGLWQHSDTPVLLWAFEHLVRGALLSWWASIPLQGAADAVSTI